MPEAGLRPAQQTPAATVTRLELRATTVTEAWQQCFAARGVREAFVRAVREFGRGRSLEELYGALGERDLPHHVVDDAVAVCQHGRRTGWLVGHAAELGCAGWTTVDDLLATATLFDGLGDAPTLTVTVREAFKQQRRDQREDVCALLARLAQGFDVRVVATGRLQRWLADSHRQDLPGVSEWGNAHQSDTPTAALVETARSMLSTDGTAVSILRRLADEPAHTLPYSALYADPSLPSDSAVRQQLGRLADLELVERLGPDQQKLVELRTAGHEFLAALDEAQQSDSERVSNPPNASSQAVLPREDGEGEGPGPYRTSYLSRPQHTAAAASAAGGVTLVPDAFPGAKGSADHSRFVSYDNARDEVVVAVRASGALQHTVSTAVALSAPWFLEQIITDARLDAVDEPPAILRDARCIGGLSDETLASASLLVDAFAEWGQTIEDMTTDLHRGEYEDRDRFRSEIMRSAHGLAGSIVHLLDALDVDITREIRVPSGLGSDDLAELGESVAMTAAIQSRYETFAAYRQLYETRDRKRSTAFSPTVDAADPLGSLIGSIVIRGTDLYRLEDDLQAALAAPAELHEDAPEFAVSVPVRWADRMDLATAVTRTLDRKRLTPTREIVSLLDALVGSPYTAATALSQLGEESVRRDLRSSELRYALTTVDADDILRDHSRSVGKLIATLLKASERLTTRDLADRADVSTQTVRNHADVLRMLDLVRRDDAGRWRLTLAFHTDDKRHRDLVPEPVCSKMRLIDTISDAAAAVLPPAEYADPEGIVDEALSYPPDPWALADHPALSPWLKLVAALTDADLPMPSSRTVRMGSRIEQQPVTDASTEQYTGRSGRRQIRDTPMSNTS